MLSTTNKKKQVEMNFEHYFYEFMSQKYGLDKLAQKYTEIYLLSIEKYKNDDTRIDLFRKFVGLDNLKLPSSIFQAYLQMIRKTNINIQVLFTSNINNLFVDF